jgi:hypothetical protein
MKKLVVVSVAALSAVALLTLPACGGSDDTPASAQAIATTTVTQTVTATADITVSSLRLIGSQVIPSRTDFASTTVGGLSGIDYDATNKRFVLVSDDRTTTDSATPPRMYTADLTFDASSFSAVKFLSTFKMKQPSGADYAKVPDALVADPEAVRIDPVNGNYLWASEGDRTLTATPTRVINPFIREIKPDGTHVREYILPSMFNMAATETGPRGNAVFEGMAFTPDKSKAVVIMEGPLFQDGLSPSLTTKSVARITVFDRTSGAASAQFAYPVESVQVAPTPTGSFTVNGATEILALSNTRFLVLERSFSVGVVGNQVRLYEIDTAPATNVLAVPALVGASYTAVTKKLVLNFDTIKAVVGNIANLEGMTFGPKLANGRNSLVVVADDNFAPATSETDRNQFLVFEVVP